MKRSLILILTCLLILSFCSSCSDSAPAVCAHDYQRVANYDRYTAVDQCKICAETRMYTDPDSETVASETTTPPTPSAPTHTECDYCGTLEDGNRWFVAKAESVSSVTPLGTGCFEAVSAMDLPMSVSYDCGIDGDITRCLVRGDIVRIIYNGLIMESYPVRISAISIESVEEVRPVDMTDRVLAAFAGSFSAERKRAAILTYQEAYSTILASELGDSRSVSFCVDFEVALCSVTHLSPVRTENVDDEVSCFVDLSTFTRWNGNQVVIATDWWSTDREGETPIWSYLVSVKDTEGGTHYYYFRVDHSAAAE